MKLNGRTTASGIVVFLTIAALLGAACSDDASSSAGSTTSDGGGDRVESGAGLAVGKPEMQADYARDDSSGAGGGTTTGVVSTLGATPEIGPSVIKNAFVELEVGKGDLSGATREAISIAGRFGGFVVSTATHDERAASADVVLRVPADAFERALADLEGLGDVNREEISGQDVGQEFVDLEARVRNLESQESVLLRLMDRSVSVSDTIRVQRELQSVQLEIEKLTGRLRYLKDQADMGTISLTLVEVGAPGHKPAAGVLAKAWARAVDVALAVVAAVIVGTGFLIPVALLALLAFLVLRAVRPRFSSQS